MASYSIHLAIANEYLKKHLNENKNSFIKGTIDVDDNPNKIKTHYTKTTNTDNLRYFLDNSIILSEYIKEHHLTTSYDKGYFLHLVTDYYFYTKFLDTNWIEKIDFKTYKEVIYHDYQATNNYINQKYKVTYPKRIQKYNISIKEKPIILTYHAIDNFIKEMAAHNLETIYKKIQKNKEELHERVISDSTTT